MGGGGGGGGGAKGYVGPPLKLLGGGLPPAPHLPMSMNRITPLNSMKRGIGILSPDKSMHLDLITKQDLVESEQFTVSLLIFRGSKCPIQVKTEQ